MIRNIILLIASFIISLPLFADPQIMLNTDIEGQLTMKRYYSQIIDDNDITNGEYYIDASGVYSDLNDVNNPFSLRDGFTTDNFIVTFFGSVESNQSHEIDVSNSSYYRLEGSTKEYISQTPSIINKTPSTGILTFYVGEYYDTTNTSLPTFTFQITSPEYQEIGAGRYYTDITISVVEV